MTKFNYACGCKGPKNDIRDFRIDSKKAGVVNFPSSFEIPRKPRVKNQGTVNSCVAHASSSILEYYSGNNAKLSTNFIYGMERKVCGETQPGMYLIDACKIIQEYGDMYEKDCPGNIEVPQCSDWVEGLLPKSEEELKKAKDFRITSYYACNNTDDIKLALMNYGPVLGCIMWYNEFKFLDKDATIQFNESSDGGYHAIMIYGWDERGFKIQNSWGESFGNKGRFILPYWYKIAEARVLIDDSTVGNDMKACLVRKSTSDIFKPLNKIINHFRKEKE